MLWSTRSCLSLSVAISAIVLLAGCATLPREPKVMVLPGGDVGFEQFRADDSACREFAAQGTVRGGDAQERYDVAYVQCMYAKGNRVPVATGGSEPFHASAPQPNVPPPPAGMPPAPPPSS